MDESKIKVALLDNLLESLDGLRQDQTVKSLKSMMGEPGDVAADMSADKSEPEAGESPEGGISVTEISAEPIDGESSESDESRGSEKDAEREADAEAKISSDGAPKPGKLDLKKLLRDSYDAATEQGWRKG